VPRPYRSPKRDEGREATRKRILAAAGKLFRTRGYPRTTIDAVAKAARVANESVYAIFGTKVELLRRVAHHEAAGDASGVVTDDWLRRVVAERGQRQRWELMRAATARVLERTQPILSVVERAADIDPEIAALRRELEEARRGDIEALVDLLEEAGPLRLPRREAIDVTWALSRSTGLFEALRIDRGWSARRAAAAVSDAIERAILP